MFVAIAVVCLTLLSQYPTTDHVDSVPRTLTELYEQRDAQKEADVDAKARAARQAKYDEQQFADKMEALIQTMNSFVTDYNKGVWPKKKADALLKSLEKAHDALQSRVGKTKGTKD